MKRWIYVWKEPVKERNYSADLWHGQGIANTRENRIGPLHNDLKH